MKTYIVIFFVIGAFSLILGIVTPAHHQMGVGLFSLGIAFWFLLQVKKENQSKTERRAK